jgi:hypothetical protein
LIASPLLLTARRTDVAAGRFGHNAGNMSP